MKPTKKAVGKFLRAISCSRPQSPNLTTSNQNLGHEACHLPDRSPIPTPTSHASTVDEPTNVTLHQAGAMEIPTIVTEENSTYSAPIPPTTVPPKTRFVQSTNAQQDIAVLHVAYILNESPRLQDLILEIVKLKDKPGFKEVVKDCVEFTTKLIAASESRVTGVDGAIVTLLKTIKNVGSDAPEKASADITRSIRQIEKHPSRFLTVASSVLGVALPMLDIPRAGSSKIPVPMLSPLIGVVAGFLHAADQASNNFEWMRWLSTTSAEYVVQIAVISPSQTDHRWARAIDKLQGKLSDIVRQAEEFSRRSIVSRFLLQGSDNGGIAIIKENLKAAIDIFNVEVEINIKLDLDNMSRKIDLVLLNNLPRLPSHSVSHDKYFRASREEEIREALQWIEEPGSERFLWIYGAAGVGKSTLIRRLFDHSKEEGILASFAYFAIGIDSDPKDLVQMMARELSSLHPGCQPDMVCAIQKCFGVHQSLDEYLTHFLINPITSLKYAGSVIIILDALDEWTYREPFLDALLRVNLSPTLFLKFIITSRYSEEMKAIFKDTARIRELAPVSETVCRDYFEERFKSVKWYGHEPNLQMLDNLVRLADGLLIWAATVCSLISVSRPNKRPHQILAEISTSSSSLGHGKRMEELHRLALERLFPDEDSRRKVFFSMVALRDPLLMTEFARLIDVLPEFIQDTCSGLRALQTRGIFDNAMVQPAIKLFPASFIDYFGPLDQARNVMADNCLNFFFKQVMEPDLIDEPDPFALGQAERYMGKHWGYHLKEASREKQSKALLLLRSDRIRFWVSWSLSNLVIVGDGNDHIDFSGLQLVSTPKITYPLETSWHNISTSQTIVGGFREVLVLGRMNYPNADFETENQQDSPGWVHIKKGLEIGLTNLGSSLFSRFQRLGDLNDINKSVGVFEEAVLLTPDGHLDKPSLLNNVGNSPLTHFERLGDLNDINNSVVAFEDAVRLTPDS